MARRKGRVAPEEEWLEEKEQWHHDHDHHGHDHHDDGEWSGFIVENCWHSEAVREMAAGYCEGEYEAFHDLVDPDATIMVNDVDLSKDEWIESFDEGKAPFDDIRHAPFDDIRHEDMVVTTMMYNNDRMFTNMWYTTARGLATSPKIAGNLRLFVVNETGEIIFRVMHPRKDLHQ